MFALYVGLVNCGGQSLVSPQTACKIRCENGGMCVFDLDRPDVHSCICLLGVYTGDRCQTKVPTPEDLSTTAAPVDPRTAPQSDVEEARRRDEERKREYERQVAERTRKQKEDRERVSEEERRRQQHEQYWKEETARREQQKVEAERRLQEQRVRDDERRRQYETERAKQEERRREEESRRLAVQREAEEARMRDEERRRQESEKELGEKRTETVNEQSEYEAEDDYPQVAEREDEYDEGYEETTTTTTTVKTTMEMEATTGRSEGDDGSDMVMEKDEMEEEEEEGEPLRKEDEQLVDSIKHVFDKAVEETVKEHPIEEDEYWDDSSKKMDDAEATVKTEEAEEYGMEEGTEGWMMVKKEHENVGSRSTILAAIKWQKSPPVVGSPDAIPAAETTAEALERDKGQSKEKGEEEMPMVVAKRNARERTRVHTVNQAFLVLKQHLPSLRQFTKRVSKLRILNAAINYIEALLKLIQSSDVIPQSTISATLGPIVPTPVRGFSKVTKPEIMLTSNHSRHLAPPPLPPRELHLSAPVATCAPDHSLVDYRPSLAMTLAPVPVQMPTVFAPQPTFPYMKSLLDYPTYLYQPPPTATAPSAQSHIIVNNQIVPMPSYQFLSVMWKKSQFSSYKKVENQEENVKSHTFNYQKLKEMEAEELPKQTSYPSASAQKTFFVPPVFAVIPQKRRKLMKPTWLLIVLAVVLFSACSAKKGGRSSSHARHYSRSKPFFTRKYSKPGSIEHTSNFRSFVFGATSGLLMFNAGRHIIQDSSEPISFGNRKYFWGESGYVPDEDLPVQCINRIDPQDPQFGRVYFDNESRPQEIVYACPADHNCCGYDCCTESTFFTSIFSLLVILLVVSVLSIFVIECLRWCLHCTYFCKHGHSRDFEPLSI
ncbi:unnamed protein product [Caenorhabditis sp. 36 PRJEB53466]|nr:unnamed protein product [Caenorhabditis sp. 36 PRJEB53466]